MTGIIVFGLAICSCATNNAPDEDPYFEDSKKFLLNLWDTSSDGIITCDDVERRKLYRFAFADSNNDGLLSLAEFGPAPWAGGDKADASHQKYDDNGDGNVSRDEFMLNAGEDFAKLDSNNDCILTDDEIRSYIGIR